LEKVGFFDVFMVKISSLSVPAKWCDKNAPKCAFGMRQQWWRCKKFHNTDFIYLSLSHTVFCMVHHQNLKIVYSRVLA